MRLDPAVLAQLAVRVDPTGYLRVMPVAYRATPLGMGFGKTRFASTHGSYKLLYAAQDLATAIAERIVRDRFQGRRRRLLTIEEIDTYVVASLSALAPLRVVDLRAAGASRLGIPTDAVRGRAQQSGRRLGQALYDSTEFDGIAYMSRITNAECIMIFDRAVGTKLDPACSVTDLIRLADLTPALASLDVRLF